MTTPRLPPVAPQTAARGARLRAWPEARVWLGALALLLALGACSAGDAPSDDASTPADAAAADASGDSESADSAAAGDDAGASDSGQTDVPPVASKPVILSVTPEQGPSTGLTEVEITGIGLGSAVNVFFAESPGVDLQVVDDYTLRVRTPPRPAGLVDLAVRITDADGNASDITLPLAFRYLADVQVHQVSPSSGDTAGGNLVTVTGSGFSANTAFIFGDRLAIDPLVLDEFSASMHTPPGKAGKVDVIVANGDGAAKASKAFQYTAKPAIAWVAPGTSPLGGGVTLKLHGTALLSDSASVAVLGPKDGGGTKPWKATITGSATDGTWLEVTAPAIEEAGSYDLVYARKGADTTAAKAVTYAHFVDLTTGEKVPSQIVAVSPASAPVNVERTIAVHIAGPIARQTQGTVEVRMSGKKLPVLWHDVGLGGSTQTAATIVVRAGPVTWSNPPVTANVRVDVGYDDATKKGAFTWTKPVPVIAKVTPGELSAAGGTPFTVHWGPATAAFGSVVGVRVGALFATKVAAGPASSHAATTVTGLAPKGSPGPADVRLILSNGDAMLADAVVYGSTFASVAALTPSRGSIAGGSLVDLVGTGLDDLDRVFVGGKQVKDLQVMHSGLARFRTPRGEPGPATLEAWFKSGPAKQLENAYVYFDPMSGNYGTWGDPIDRDVNVTVLQANAGGGRVDDALVVVERGDKVWTGKTNDAGQVTVSVPGLTGPVTVSASKPGYTAASVVKVSVRNVTIRLRKVVSPPPSSGSGEPPTGPEDDPFPDGVIEGVVVNAAKYTQLPMGDCAQQPAVGGNCKPCKTSADCFGGQSCELLRDPLQGFDLGAGLDGIPGASESTGTVAAGQQRYCAAGCVEDKDCPGDFECRAVSLAANAPIYRCTPRIGKAQTRCVTSSPSMWGGNPNPGSGWIADSEGKFKIDSRLGDVAVACRAGYVEKFTGKFVPLMLGLTRNLHVFPGATVKGVKVMLTTPMTRTVRVRLDRLPMGNDVIGNMRYMYAALNLDPEGYILTADVETTLHTDVLELPRQPSTFAGDLNGVSYDLYGGLASPTGGSPTTVAAREDVKPTDADHLAFWPTGSSKPGKADAWSVPVLAMHTDGYSTVAVGDKGWIGVWGAGAFTQQQSPTKRDLHAVWMDPAGSGDGWAGGDYGTLLRRNNLTGWQAFDSPVAQPPVGAASDAWTVRAIHGRNASDVWLLSGRNQLYHWDGKGWAGPFAGPLAPPKPKPNTWGPWQDDARLRALFHANDGTLLVVGDKGAVMRGTWLPSVGGIGWQTVQSLTNHSLHAVWGLNAEDFWVAGDAGTLAHYAGGKMVKLHTGVLLPFYALAGTPSGLHAVGGLGSWVTVDLAGKLSDRSMSDLSVDLHGVAQVAGGLVAAGQPMVVMGPYLELPYITEPKINGTIGKWLRWTAKPGVTPTLHMVRITDYSYRTLWELYVKGDVNEVKLPDFEKLGSFSPLPGGKMRVRLWRIYAPGLDIDHYNHKQLNVWKWISYAYNWVLTDQPTDLSGVGLPPPSVPGGAEIPKLPPPP